MHNLLEKLEIPEGIASNISLLENVFVLFVCIQNNIPCLITGEPGCSKTLAVILLVNSLKGKDSLNEYIRTLPALKLSSYQGH